MVALRLVPSSRDGNARYTHRCATHPAADNIRSLEVLQALFVAREGRLLAELLAAMKPARTGEQVCSARLWRRGQAGHHPLASFDWQAVGHRDSHHAGWPPGGRKAGRSVRGDQQKAALLAATALGRAHLSRPCGPPV